MFGPPFSADEAKTNRERLREALPKIQKCPK
jgi:hypothetical protein